ncbi:MAG: DNA primase [Actinomycetota bacterium]|nr:DNA primase [Actinomycetota bacterium]
MARIRDSDIDALRERADIVELVSTYTKLKKAGGHTFKGLCPFHSEKTPSFTVDTAKGLWHCFGCGEGGNVYGFVQKIENLPFPEAVEWLASKTGYPLTYEEARPGDEMNRGLKARILEGNEVAARFFHEALMNSEDAAPARAYLEGRDFTKEIAARWALGYAPGRNSLCTHLLRKGFSEKEIELSDLGRRSDRDQSLYDTFRQRITFPTWDLQGRVVGFGARALGDQQPKYLNSSETPVFSKSRVLYGLNRAKSRLARDEGVAVVVEGYTDVISMHEAGFGETIATNGVALGETHFEQLKKFTHRAVLMLDADAAGKGATERSFGAHHRIGLEVLVAPLPPGRDPADVIKEDGPEAIQKVLTAARPLLEFKLEETIEKLPTDTPEARSRAVREAVKVLGLHPDPIARHQYAFVAARRIGVDVEAVQRALEEERLGSEPQGGGVVRSPERRLPGHVKVEREALRLLLSRSNEVASWVEQLDESCFTSPVRRELFSVARARMGATKHVDAASIAHDLSDQGRQLLTELLVEDSSRGPMATSGFGEVFIRLDVFRLERSIKQKRDVLQDLNPTLEPARHDELFTELVGLEAERRDMLRRLQGAA